MRTKVITVVGVVGLVASLAAHPSALLGMPRAISEGQAPAPRLPHASALVGVARAPIEGQGQAARTPGGAPDLRQVLYDMADSIGMLRNAQEVDRIGSMNYWATGTVMSGTQTCKVVDYRASVNWIHKGMRVDYKCDGSPQRHVEVVKDNLAWNETEPGKGGTPVTGAANDRALLLWTLPAGAIKAANEAGAATKVAVESGRTVVNFPIASLNATMKLTLDKDSHIEQVESRMGTTTTVTIYGEYGDWNGADYLSDVLFPKRIVQKRGTAAIMDLTVTKTNTYNPYVILPVPANVTATGAR